ncbi:MAG: TPMT family class I SAM-dependent methyltransferase [Bacteroidetes bacterium]|nr:TPMT family class I SAM-dependent methyltransferase [Bacteroidota bacterium]
MDKTYWNRKYTENSLTWDIGYASTPLREYFDGISNRDIRVLVPGAGNGYEAEYLHKAGFGNVFIIEISSAAIRNFRKRVPDFPSDRIIEGDFFEHKGKYDLIIEQTFFCSIERERRREYAKKMHDLLNAGGKLIGLLFNHEFDGTEPPFGGTKEEYETLFFPYFNLDIIETAYNSIKPRRGRELFLKFTVR